MSSCIQRPHPSWLYLTHLHPSWARWSSSLLLPPSLCRARDPKVWMPFSWAWWTQISQKKPHLNFEGNQSQTWHTVTWVGLTSALIFWGFAAFNTAKLAKRTWVFRVSDSFFLSSATIWHLFSQVPDELNTSIVSRSPVKNSTFQVFGGPRMLEIKPFPWFLLRYFETVAHFLDRFLARQEFFCSKDLPGWKNHMTNEVLCVI